MSTHKPDPQIRHPEKPPEQPARELPASAHPDGHAQNPESHKDIERRLDALEKNTAELRKDYFDGHKWFTTFIFSLVGLLLYVMGTQSKSDVHEAIVDMKSDVQESTMAMQRRMDAATADMEKKINALAGEALKKPELQLSNKSGPLNGQLIKVAGIPNMQNPLYPLFIKNTGDKSTDSLSIRLYTSSPLLFNGNSGTWVAFISSDTKFPAGYYFTFNTHAGFGSPRINPQETWTLDSSEEINATSLSAMGTNRLVDCKLLIFFGAEKPAEADFKLDFTGML